MVPPGFGGGRGSWGPAAPQGRARDAADCPQPIALGLPPLLSPRRGSQRIEDGGCWSLSLAPDAPPARTGHGKGLGSAASAAREAFQWVLHPFGYHTSPTQPTTHPPDSSRSQGPAISQMLNEEPGENPPAPPHATRGYLCLNLLFHLFPWGDNYCNRSFFLVTLATGCLSRQITNSLTFCRRKMLLGRFPSTPKRLHKGAEIGAVRSPNPT